MEQLSRSLQSLQCCNNTGKIMNIPKLVRLRRLPPDTVSADMDAGYNHLVCSLLHNMERADMLGPSLCAVNGLLDRVPVLTTGTQGILTFALQGLLERHMVSNLVEACMCIDTAAKLWSGVLSADEETQPPVPTVLLNLVCKTMGMHCGDVIVQTRAHHFLRTTSLRIDSASLAPIIDTMRSHALAHERDRIETLEALLSGPAVSRRCVLAGLKVVMLCMARARDKADTPYDSMHAYLAGVRTVTNVLTVHPAVNSPQDLLACVEALCVCAPRARLVHPLPIHALRVCMDRFYDGMADVANVHHVVDIVRRVDGFMTWPPNAQPATCSSCSVWDTCSREKRSAPELRRTSTWSTLVATVFGTPPNHPWLSTWPTCCTCKKQRPSKLPPSVAAANLMQARLVTTPSSCRVDTPCTQSV